MSLLIALAAALVGLQLAMAAAAGGLTYPLDDPYIHLQMADARAAGHFGLGPDRGAAASSSILWPYLLAPFVVTPLALAGPAILSTAGALALGVAAWRAAGLVFGDTAPVRWPAAAVGTVASHALSLGVLGMEHGLQGALVAWAAIGLCETERDGRPPTWLAGPLVVVPLVRYECLGLPLLAAAWLWLRGHRGAASVVGLAPIALLAAWSAALYPHTGHLLPNSVLSKRSLFLSAWHEPWQPTVWMPLALGVLCAGRSRSRWLGLPGMVVAATLAHAAFGQVGIFFRYVAYLMPWALILCGWTARDALRAAWVAGGSSRRTLGLAALLLGVPAVNPLRYLPAASAHVAQLHGGMRTIALAAGGVAVNDIGLVGWRSPVTAVDLLGLADNETLRHQLAKDPPQWMDEVVTARGVGLVLVFRSWFRDVPERWVELGDLAVARSVFGEDHGAVVIYAVDPGEADAWRARLADLRPSLPPGAVLTLR